MNEQHEEPAPYGARPPDPRPTPGSPRPAPSNPGPPATVDSTRPRKVRIPYLARLKHRGEKWAMLTAYDQYSAQIFDEAGIPVLLVGDSAANNLLATRPPCRSP